MNEKKFIGIKEAAAYLNLSVRYMYQLVQKGKIPAYRPSGKNLLFKVAELDEWVVKSAIKMEGTV